MADEEDYVGQLKDVFEDCDNSGQGLLGKEDLVRLCEKLQVDDQAAALVERLIGTSDHKKVGFEEFKDGFVAVLSTCADLISTEDDFSASASSFAEEGAVSPKFIRDGKKYGRRSKPSIEENQGSETPLDFADISDIETDSYNSPAPTPKPNSGSRKLHTTPVNPGMAARVTPDNGMDRMVLSPNDHSAADIFEGEGLLNKSMGGTFDKSSHEEASEEELLKEIWRKQGVGKDGYLTFDELGVVCENIGMEKMNEEELGNLFDKLDADSDGRVSFHEFVDGLSQHGSHVPIQSSRPHSASGRKLKLTSSMNMDSSERRTQTPNIMSAITGSGYFSYLDPDTSGYAQPEEIVELWESFGISRDDVVAVLEALDFDLNMKINLQELSSVLEQELLNYELDNAVYQVAIYSCRQELRYIKGALETYVAEREKLKEDVDAAKARNEILIKEADERHTTQEKQHEAKTLTIEGKYQDQLKSLQNQLDQDRELFTTNAHIEKQRLEDILSKMRAEEIRLKQELQFNQRELASVEKELHGHIDRNSVLEKENERVKRELDSVSQLHRKMEEMESHRTQLTSEQHRFSERKIKELEAENKTLRDQTDELTLEMESVNQQLLGGKITARGEGRRSRRGSLLSDYTMASTEKDGGASSSGDEEVERKKKRASTPSREEEMLKLDILKLKDQHAGEILKLKKVHDTDKLDLQQAFQNDMEELERKCRVQIAKIEQQMDEERLRVSNLDSEWRRKHETEKAQIKLAATHERMDLMNKLQDEHREQTKQLRKELNTRSENDVKNVKDQFTQEKEALEKRNNKKIQEFENMLERGAEGLRGKLRDDFYRLVEEQAQNEIEVEKRHLDAQWEKERDELYDILNKEKQSMEDQFNDRLYDLEEQMDDAEEDVRNECEEEFLEQIQTVQQAFDEERGDYENQINDLKRQIKQLEIKMQNSMHTYEVESARNQRDEMMNERDQILLEKNKIMLERNALEKENEYHRKTFEKEKTILQSQLDEMQRITTSTGDTDKVAMNALVQDKSILMEEKRSLEEEKCSLKDQLEQTSEKIFLLTTDLHLAKSQHSREIEDLKSRAHKTVNSDIHKDVEKRLSAERSKVSELEEALRVNSHEGSQLFSDALDDSKKTLTKLAVEKEEYKRHLLATRQCLNEVTEKLKLQLSKGTKMNMLVKELYSENADLMEALYVTEKRQKSAERSSFKMRTKYHSLSGVFQKMVPAVMEAVSP